MNRILFEASELAADGAATFADARARHVLDVLHGAVGQTLKTGTIDGAIGTAEILSVTSDVVTVRTRHDTPSPRPWIDLVLAPPRPRVLKRLLPQLATLGVGRIVLVGAAKVEKAFWGAQLLKPEVYRPLLVEGLQQAGTSILPDVQLARNFRSWLAHDLDAVFPAPRPRFVAHPYAAAGASSNPSAAVVPATMPDARPLLAVGPEGGWTDDEVAALEAKGFVRYSLGGRILRTDTALIALLARLMPVFDAAAITSAS